MQLSAAAMTNIILYSLLQPHRGGVGTFRDHRSRLQYNVCTFRGHPENILKIKLHDNEQKTKNHAPRTKNYELIP